MKKEKMEHISLSNQHSQLIGVNKIINLISISILNCYLGKNRKYNSYIPYIRKKINNRKNKKRVIFYRKK